MEPRCPLNIQSMDSTVKRRVQAIANDQEGTLTEWLCDILCSSNGCQHRRKKCPYFDISSRFMIHEDILYCLPLPEHETAKAMDDVTTFSTCCVKSPMLVSELWRVSERSYGTHTLQNTWEVFLIKTKIKTLKEGRKWWAKFEPH